ncbi:hypothetical protein [Sorangium sp. So ce145]|uniref:hypothetical protein n=1 Tax=Sorangium sp. So ce145 TaxID=3133285 RepID=UPI003F6302BA
MTLRGARIIPTGFFALICASSGCALVLGLDDFEDSPSPEDQNEGGNGSADVCRPNITEACYSGPEGTADIGLCKSGTRTCDDSGSTWGACQNEKLPVQESCAINDDENCDGFDCTLWARAFGSESVAHSVATDRQGNIIAVGGFSQSIQFGTEPLTSAGDSDIFIVALDKDGDHIWSHSFGDAAAQEATSVSVDAEDNILLTGVSDGTINFGDSDVGPGLFVAKFSNSGEHTWSRSFPAKIINDRYFNKFTRTIRPKISSTQHGDAFISGTFIGNIEFDDAILTSAPADTLDMYAAKLDGKTGSTSTAQGGWARTFGSSGDDALIDATIDRSDNIVIIGNHPSSIRFGDSPELDGAGMFLTKLDSDGSPVWTRDFDNGYPSALAVDNLGNISATGNYDERIEFDSSHALGSPDGHTAFFVVQFDASGKHRWSRDFEGTSHNAIKGISNDTLNNVVLIGEFSGELRVDNEIMDHDELPSPWVLKLDSSGETLWKRSYRSGGPSFGFAAKAAPSNETIIIGSFYRTIAFESGTLQTDYDTMFLAKLGI